MASEISTGSFRAGMSRLASAVSIVATGLPAEPAGWQGMTATAICSLCSEPPSLVACLNRDTRTCYKVQRNGIFSVNVLANHHAELARIFTGHTGLFGAERFTVQDWATGTLGGPVLVDALVSFECKVAQSIPHGTHSLLIGRIMAVRWTDGNEPLVYHRRRYHDLAQQIEATGELTP